MPDISAVNKHNGFFRNAELEHLKQLNTDLHESWKYTVSIKCIFDILASRETHFLCSFTSPLYFHLRFNYLPSSHLRMCRQPFTIHAKPYMWEARIPSFQKQNVDKLFWLDSMCFRQSQKDASCIPRISMSLKWNVLFGVLIYIT